jgi:hypothetical protein
VGLRYRAMLPSTSLPAAGSTLSRIVGDFETSLNSRDRGSVRAGNDHTFDSRARHFVDWLGVEGISWSELVQAVRLSDERVVISVLGRFLESVSQGGGLRSTANPAAGTLAGYLRAAHTLLESATGVTIPYVYSGAMAKGSGSSRIHSALADILAQQHAWCKPQQKKEPFTHDLLGSLHCHVDYLASLDPATSLDRTAAVFDWLALGLHTGSRLGEYGQSKPSKKHLFATVPAGPHTGEPLAFMRSDFVFWDAAMIQIPLSLAIARPSAVFEGLLPDCFAAL